jgi:hypothetical protein
MHIHRRLGKETQLELKEIDKHTIRGLYEMELCCSLENAETPEEIGRPPIQGHLLEVLAEAMKGNPNPGLHMVGKVGAWKWAQKFCLRGSDHCKVLPERLNRQPVVDVERLGKGLALLQALAVHSGPTLRVVEDAEPLEVGIEPRIRVMTPRDASARAQGGMSTLVATDADSRSLVSCFELLYVNPRPQCEAANKDKLRGIDDEDGCRSMLFGKVHIQPELTQEISPPLVSEQVHL